MRNICYAHTRSFSALQSLPESLLGWHSELASPRFSVESLKKHSHKVSKQSQLASSSNEVKYSCLRCLCCVINIKFRGQNKELKIENEKHSGKWILAESNNWFYFDLWANLVSDFKSSSCHCFLLQIMSFQKHHVLIVRFSVTFTDMFLQKRQQKARLERETHVLKKVSGLRWMTITILFPSIY